MSLLERDGTAAGCTRRARRNQRLTRDTSFQAGFALRQTVRAPSVPAAYRGRAIGPPRVRGEVLAHAPFFSLAVARVQTKTPDRSALRRKNPGSMKLSLRRDDTARGASPRQHSPRTLTSRLRSPPNFSLYAAITYRLSCRTRPTPCRRNARAARTRSERSRQRWCSI